MSAVLVTTATSRTPLQVRLSGLLNAMAEGLWRGEDCRECPGSAASPADRCPACAQADDEVGHLDTGMTAVNEAVTGAGALSAYFDCLALVAGLSVEVEAITAGGDAGTEGKTAIPGVGK